MVFVLREKSIPGVWRPGAVGDSGAQTAGPWQGLGLSIGASLGGVQGVIPGKALPKAGRQVLDPAQRMKELPSPAEPLLVVLRAGHSWDPRTVEVLLFLWVYGFFSFILQLAFTVPTKILYLGSLWHHNYTRIAQILASLCF